MRTFFIGIGIIIFVIFLFALLNKWRRGITLFFIWILIEDFIRIHTGNNIIVYFMKDVLLVAIYFRFLWEYPILRKAYPWRNPIFISTILFFLLALLQSFNPNIENKLIPILGLRVNFFYVPLIYLAYYYLDTGERLRKFLSLAVIPCMLISILVMVQVYTGHEWWLKFFGNPKMLPLYSIHTNIAGSLFHRPNGIFADAGRFIQYSTILIFFAIGYHSILKTQKSKLVALFSIAVIFLSMIFSGTRSGVIIHLAGLGLIYGISSLTQLRKTLHKTMATLGVIALIAVGVTAYSQIYSEEKMQQRFDFLVVTLDPGSEHFEVGGRGQMHLDEIKLAFDKAGFFGWGTGMNTLGMRYIIDRDAKINRLGGFEDGYASLIAEFGILGPVVWLIWIFHLIFCSFKIAFRLRMSKYAQLSLSLAVLHAMIPVLHFIGRQIMHNYLVCIFIWFSAGMQFALPRIAQQESQREKEISPPETKGQAG